jgi:hypothetical protein
MLELIVDYYSTFGGNVWSFLVNADAAKFQRRSLLHQHYSSSRGGKNNYNFLQSTKSQQLSGDPFHHSRKLSTSWVGSLLKGLVPIWGGKGFVLGTSGASGKCAQSMYV